MPKIKYQTSLKVQAVTRLIQDNEPISSICEDLKISPVVLEQWRKEVIGSLSLVFDHSLKKAEREAEKKINELMQEVARKQELIGELMEAFTFSKKSLGRTDRELLAQHGFIYSNASPYYPQSNGKLEKFHVSLKNELPGGKEMMSFEYAKQLIEQLIDYYNNVRLHSAIGYVTPRDMLAGRAPAIQAEHERKLKDAREGRRLVNRRRKITLTAHCETEDGSAGEQPSMDSDAVERR